MEKVVGFICNLEGFKSAKKAYTKYLLHRIHVMTEVLNSMGCSLFIYCPTHVDKRTHLVEGYRYDNGIFRKKKQKIPLINSDWFTGRRRKLNKYCYSIGEFRKWLKGTGRKLFLDPNFSKILKDKFLTYQMISAFNSKLQPYTELYKGTEQQLRQFFESYNFVFLKEVRGSKGIGSVTIKREGGGYLLNYYLLDEKKSWKFETLDELKEKLQTLIGDKQYIIQKGVKGVKFQNSIFDVRVIMLNDGKKWHSIRKARVGKPCSDLSNIHQGGKNYRLEEVISTETLKTIDDVSFRLMESLSNLFPGKLHEVAFDFIIDASGGIHLLELNSKPGVWVYHDFYNRDAADQKHYNELTYPHGKYLAEFLYHKRLEMEVEIKAFGELQEPTAVLVGDTSPGENYQEKLKRNILKDKGYDYSFEKVKQILLDANLVVANLETPITDLKKSPFEGKKSYIHYSDVEKTPKLLKKLNITAVNLANNHTGDFGEEGALQTVKLLQDQEIVSFGSGESYIDEKQNLAVVGMFKEKAVDIGELKKRGLFVIASPHWGKNYQWVSNKQKREARELLALGADLIIGHGAHMMQEIEKIEGRWVIYSIGNFVFNSPGRYAKKNVPPYSLIARLSQRKTLRLYPIVTDNKETNYQTRPVDEEEFLHVIDLLKNRGAPVKEMLFGKDRYGFCFEITLNG